MLNTCSKNINSRAVTFDHHFLCNVIIVFTAHQLIIFGKFRKILAVCKRCFSIPIESHSQTHIDSKLMNSLPLINYWKLAKKHCERSKANCFCLFYFFKLVLCIRRTENNNLLLIKNVEFYIRKIEIEIRIKMKVFFINILLGSFWNLFLFIFFPLNLNCFNFEIKNHKKIQ